MTQKIVTRFAPSPTGFLHIGGARTALFNWLYAQTKGGSMRLRIEDTDRARSTDEAIEAILEGLKWLGLEWQGEPVYQHQQAARHQEIAHKLLAEGKAYRCYCSPEELQAMREEARKHGRTAGYDGRWRNRDSHQAPEGVSPVIRFKAPQEGQTILEDEVQGRVVFANKDLDDLILLRSDGSPTYMLSVIVDDHDMEISHIIRGDDHLTNAVRQSQIYSALGWTAPIFAHLPLIHGADGAKLSKRHGALGVEAYRDRGYLPEAMRNYLVRLGWAHGDDEIFSTEQMIEWFDLGAIGRSPARFDFAKLENMNGHYIRHAEDQDLLSQIAALLPHLGEDIIAHRPLCGEDFGRLKCALPGLKERAKTLIELIEMAAYLFVKRPLILTPKTEKLLSGGAQEVLASVFTALSQIDLWESQSLERAVRETAEKCDLKLGKIAQPLRAALTGTTISPGIFDVLFVLGRDESLARIEDQIHTLAEETEGNP